MSHQQRQDKTIQCKDCGADFIFSVDDQEYYASQRFVDPKRCPGCRRKKRDGKRAAGSQ